MLLSFTVAAFVGFLSWAPVARAQDSTIRAVQNIFDPLSAPAETIYSVSLLVLAVCVAIFLIVGGLLTYAIIRYRRRGPEDDQEEPPQVYGSAAIELAWTVPPILIVVMLVLVTARTIGEIEHHQMPAAAEEIQSEEAELLSLISSPNFSVELLGSKLRQFAERQRCT